MTPSQSGATAEVVDGILIINIQDGNNGTFFIATSGGEITLEADFEITSSLSGWDSGPGYAEFENRDGYTGIRIVADSGDVVLGEIDFSGGNLPDGVTVQPSTVGSFDFDSTPPTYTDTSTDTVYYGLIPTAVTGIEIEVATPLISGANILIVAFAGLFFLLLGLSFGGKILRYIASNINFR